MSGSMRDLDYLQADNEMKTLPASPAERATFRVSPPKCRISSRRSTRIYGLNTNWYIAHQRQAGRHISQAEGGLVDDEGQPLRIQDEKHKPLKYDILAREGYRAKQEVE